MLDLNQICQPGERVTIVTRTKIIVTTVKEVDPDQQGFCQGPTTIENSWVERDQYVAEEPEPDQCDGLLTIRTRGVRGCAVDLEVAVVRERGQDS